MDKITRAWLDTQIERELERGCCANAVRDLAALITVRDGLYADASPAAMRDYNVVTFQDYHDNRGAGDMREYGRRYAPEGRTSSKRLSKEMAEKWVSSMHGADGSHGGRWTLDEIKRYAANFGVSGEENVIEFFAVINAMYSDYSQVAKKYGVDKPDFYADLAKAFIADADAKAGKVMLYYTDIAQAD